MKIILFFVFVFGYTKIINSYLYFEKFKDSELIILIELLLISLILLDIYNYIIIGILLIALIIDYKEMWIPDYTIIITLIIKLYLFLISNNKDYSGMIFMLFLSIVIIICSFIIKCELIGFADLKLFVVLSIGFNLIDSTIFLLISSLIGIIMFVILKKKKFAFGPSIILAYFLIELAKIKSFMI